MNPVPAPTPAEQAQKPINWKSDPKQLINETFLSLTAYPSFFFPIKKTFDENTKRKKKKKIENKEQRNTTVS